MTGAAPLLDHRVDGPQAGEASLTLAALRGWAATDERTLRFQHPGGTLPPYAERILASPAYDPTTALGALRRWGYIKHLYHTRSDRDRESESEERRREAMRALMNRDPVLLHLGPHTVPVTSRSYAALYEIARHAVRLQDIDSDLARVAALQTAAVAALTAARGRGARGRARRRWRRLGELHTRLIGEALLHRRAIYAHLMTPDGRPATHLDQAPAWADAVTPEWDRLLMEALREAGPGRVEKLGDPPERPDAAEPLEDWSWDGFFAALERGAKAPPAAYRDQDLYRLVAWARAGAPPPYGASEEATDL